MKCTVHSDRSRYGDGDQTEETLETHGRQMIPRWFVSEIEWRKVVHHIILRSISTDLNQSIDKCFARTMIIEFNQQKCHILVPLKSSVIDEDQ
jgi:hypothetical protein